MAEPETGQDWSPLEFRRPAFRPADLRLIGDMYSDPLTKAIRNDAFAYRPPVWSGDMRHVLALLAERLSDAVEVVIRKGALPFVETLDWSLGFSALERASR